MKDAVPYSKSVGATFGQLQVQYLLFGVAKRRTVLAQCLCSCGTFHLCAVMNLRNGNTKSCGCTTYTRVAKARTTHGGTRHSKKEYRAWQAMKNRCYNAESADYSNWGGRGIRVSSSWAFDFEQFLLDMGPAPSPRHSLDRIDVNGNYEKGNCRWATAKIQQNNRSNNTRYYFRGEWLTKSQLTDKYGGTTQRLKKRLARGWALEDAVLKGDSYARS